MAHIAPNNSARFTTGNTLNHILVMTFSSSISLLVLFLVDLADLFFISQLGHIALASAIGYAGTVLFFTTSIGIGISIACGALVSRSQGAGRSDKGKCYVYSVFAAGFVFSTIIAIIIWLLVPQLLKLFGATGQAHEYATTYLRIIIPSMPILIIGMCSNTTLRALGFAKQSMLTMISGSIVNAIFDPILIFGLGLEIKGAAIASVLSRFAMMGVGLYYIIKIHGYIKRPSFNEIKNYTKDLFSIAFPAILTNVATPFGNAIVMANMSSFGDSAVAGMSVIARLIPFSFVAIFALSGAVGPIIGQNFGAKKFDRIEQAFRQALIFSLCYSVFIAVVLNISQPLIIHLFQLHGDASDLVNFFCLWIALTFGFNGLQFICNAMFNNTGLAKYSTIMNFAKATLGTIPFVYLGSYLGGAKGILAGQAIGAIVVSLFTYLLYKHLIKRFKTGENIKVNEQEFKRRFPSWPFSRTNG